MSLNWCVQICFCFWSTIFALLHCFALFSRTTKNKKQRKRKKVIPMEQALDQGFQYPLCVFTDWSAKSLCWLGHWLWMTEWYQYEAGSDLTRSQSSFGLIPNTPCASFGHASRVPSPSYTAFPSPQTRLAIPASKWRHWTRVRIQIPIWKMHL